MKEVDKQQDKCSICFKEFELVLLLNEHYIVCKKTLQCKQCKKYSDTVMEFEKHKKCKQIYHCDVCGKKFDDVSECTKHMELCVGKLKCPNYNKHLHIGNCYFNTMKICMRINHEYILQNICFILFLKKTIYQLYIYMYFPSF